MGHYAESKVLHDLIQEGNADEDGDNLISEGEYERQEYGFFHFA